MKNLRTVGAVNKEMFIELNRFTQKMSIMLFSNMLFFRMLK